MKTCRKCLASKPLDAFHRNKGRKDGRQDRCADCVKEYLRGYYRANKDKYVVNDPERIARHRDAQWLRLQDPEVREAKRARDREAYRKNPEVWKAGAMRRRAREQGAPIRHFTDRDWRRIVERQRGECHYCGARVTLTKEHLIPLSRGGSHSVGNIVGACMDCNARKHTRTRSEFLVWLRRKAVA